MDTRDDMWKARIALKKHEENKPREEPEKSRITPLDEVNKIE